LREVKIGFLTLAALAVLAVGTFLIGERDNAFSLKHRYFVQFTQVGGLAAGNPVQLSGVNVGRVEEVVLPEGVAEEELTVWLTIDRRYAARVRGDSLARIKTLGLLGDKYIEVTSGSPESAAIPNGGEIPAAPLTDVDRLITSGGDVVENVVAISSSLRRILADMEAGKGILGELTHDSEAGRRAKEAFVSIIESIESIVRKIERGDGTLASLINKDDLALRAHETLDRIEGVLGLMEEGEGTLAALLSDPETRDRVQNTVGHLEQASSDLARFTAEIDASEGLLKKLLSDEAYSREVSEDLQRLIRNLSLLSDRLERGDGTLGQMINDPSVHQALDDILVGIDESHLLRWLIRNRQTKGIEKRYEAEGGDAEGGDPEGG
jgi:phospholipid/cholesterol/gamma-HCH transport system substrate-binding protein